MNIVDIICLVIIVFYTILGLKRGAIKTVVSLVGTCAVLILAWTFKGALAGFLMKNLPFFDFPGMFKGMTAINILIYELISFIVLFVILYCILNILLSISGLIEKLLEFTVILAIPSKIIGAILGLLEGVITAFLVVFIMFHLSFTNNLVGNSRLGIIVLERTPIIGSLAVSTTLTLEDVNKIINDFKNAENKEDANFRILHTLIYYRVISSEDAQALIDSKKLNFTNTIIL